MNNAVESRFVVSAVSIRRWLLPCVGLLLVSPTVGAQTPVVAAAAAPLTPAVVPSDARPLRRVTLTVSLLHILGPALQLTSEVRLHPRMSAAGVAGVGCLGRDSGLELGGQLRAYVLGDFDHGLNVGAEGLYSPGVRDFSGLWVNPFLGYKFASRSGFTVDVQLGARIHAVRAFVMNESRLSTLVNLRAGWSF